MVDWFRILADLEKCGVNNSEVARRLGMAPSTIYRWKMAESEPSYSDGSRLLEIHGYVIAQYQSSSFPLLQSK